MTPYILILVAYFFVLAGCSYDGDPTCMRMACALGTAGFALAAMRLRRSSSPQRKRNLAAALLGVPLVMATVFLIYLELA